ncbi:hypothetical protein HPULCUR_009998 [Helicostylum pulchrum]|uniref:Uncharacterized protein n=1 Tax=Helicostylum pulchrum TaxID=562976 RepID=A0ABP9YCZ8_9FUNG
MAHAASPTWNDFTTAFTARYGLNVHEERACCARELTMIKVLPGHKGIEPDAHKVLMFSEIELTRHDGIGE